METLKVWAGPRLPLVGRAVFSILEDLGSLPAFSTWSANRVLSSGVVVVVVAAVAHSTSHRQEGKPVARETGWCAALGDISGLRARFHERPWWAPKTRSNSTSYFLWSPWGLATLQTEAMLCVGHGVLCSTREATLQGLKGCDIDGTPYCS